MQGGVKDDLDDDIAAAFSFSTQGDTIGFMLALEWESDKFTAQMMAAVVQGPCDRTLGREVQVDPINPTLKAPGIKRLKLKYYELLSNFAFKFNLRRYTSAWP